MHASGAGFGLCGQALSDSMCPHFFIGDVEDEALAQSMVIPSACAGLVAEWCAAAEGACGEQHGVALF